MITLELKLIIPPLWHKYATWEVLTPSHVMKLLDKYGSGASPETYGFL